jgi:hypothetical protein
MTTQYHCEHVLTAIAKASEAMGDNPEGLRHMGDLKRLIAALPDTPVTVALDADMYWNDADTEGFAGSTPDDAVRYVADDIPTSEMPVTLTFQCAKTLPNVQALVNGLDGNGDLQYT